MPPPDSGAAAVSATAAARPRRRARRRESAYVKSCMDRLLDDLRQDEIEGRPQHILTWARRPGGARSGVGARGVQAALVERADGSQEAAGPALDGADGGARAGLVDHPHDHPVVEP